ncbi:KfrB domain-containing protein [Pseudoalteromonas sp. SSM20]|uniref:KfrB domain-containing protein n=1 Tax=Pseudoalteromonas sp. SSM20 TaxID=3139394 RepID=UPI003BAD1F16
MSKFRVLVMNGQKLLEKEVQNKWQVEKVDKSSLKAGIYNIYNAKEADSNSEYSGVIIHSGNETTYQEVGKNKFVSHKTESLGVSVKDGTNLTISYSEGKVSVSQNTQTQKKGLKR